MISVFAAILFIETVQRNTSLSRIATYRHEYDEFVHYKFKAFISVDNQHMINKIKQNKIMLVIDEPTVYDLLVTPPFGYYSAPCKSLKISKNKTSHFTLEWRDYKPITSNYLMIEIDCAFNAGTARHASVPNKLEQTPMSESINNKLNYDDPIDRSNNESENRIKNKLNLEYNKQQNKTEKYYLES
ncbi:1709_t:CDS:2 [Gigaspora margarita]|uniref:1709_t:CDS:1 n=1 Tax=Gigaspora margarita TaxID=4874 RepID=A0ABN7UZ82_GIGMA|nr:1709_t:CDS:2 [Gigaspora margarita]